MSDTETTQQRPRPRCRMLPGSLDAADTYEMCAEELDDALAAADREEPKR